MSCIPVNLLVFCCNECVKSIVIQFEIIIGYETKIYSEDSLSASDYKYRLWFIWKLVIYLSISCTVDWTYFF